MSPTSLANLNNRRALLRPIPFHRSSLVYLGRLSRSARLFILFSALFALFKVMRVNSNLTANSRHRLASQGGLNDPADLTKFPIYPFAPSQILRMPAKVHYANGVVQQVFATPAVNEDSFFEGKREGAKTKMWDEGEVSHIDIPFGVTLTITNEESVSVKVQRAQNPCIGGLCEGARFVSLQEDFLVGLRQMRELGEDSASSITMHFHSQKIWPSTSVTLVTQFTLSRLSRFERILQEWDGPISAAIYFTDHSDISQFEYYLAKPSNLAAFRRIGLTLVKPSYSLSSEAVVERLRYPINKLRNVALSIAPSDYVMVSDVDFVPSPNMHYILQTRGVPLIRKSSRTTASPTLKRTAIAVSAFVLSPTYQGSYPRSSKDLESMFTSHNPAAALTDPNAGHGPSYPTLLFQPTSLLDPSSWSFELCYEPQWEPYYVLHRPSHPLYDERFSDQGGDKQSHALLLAALRYEFRMLRDIWLMHPPKNDEELEQWPSARLVSSELDNDIPDPVHFSKAQSDRDRFRYFQDFLPEIQSSWGWNMRWPTGCAARVVGLRSFGKPMAGSLFGL